MSTDLRGSAWYTIWCISNPIRVKVNEFSHLFSLTLLRFDAIVVCVRVCCFFLLRFYLFNLQSINAKRSVNCCWWIDIDGNTRWFCRLHALSNSFVCTAGAQSVDDADANDDPEVVYFCNLHKHCDESSRSNFPRAKREKTGIDLTCLKIQRFVTK